MNISTIEQGEELLSGVTPGKWQPEGYGITSGEYKAFTTCRSHTDTEFICWARNHASELLQCAREVEGLKARIEVLENPLPTQEEEREFYHRAYHVCHTGCPMPCPNRT